MPSVDSLPWKLLLVLLLGRVASVTNPSSASASVTHRDRLAACPTCHVYSYVWWRDHIRGGDCQDFVVSSAGFSDKVRCSLETVDGKTVKIFRFPVGIFELGEQLLMPPSTWLVGAANPNDPRDPSRSPEWTEQTVFLATRGATQYERAYCHASDMVTTRVGLVLSSYCSVRNISMQGLDTIRPMDNGALCGGGALETKGCASNDCSGTANTGGSDGVASRAVHIEAIRLNDFFFQEDKSKIGLPVPGNYQCSTNRWTEECCFCKPNGVRSTQVGVWIPETRSGYTENITIKNLVMRSGQADGINLHGKVIGALVQDVYIENTGDDTFAVWGADSNPSAVSFVNCTAVNPGIMRPKWYGNCVATYGLQSVSFTNLTCRAPSLRDPIKQPESGEVAIDTSMFVFYTSFGGSYPPGNAVRISGWRFEDLSGQSYTLQQGANASEAGEGKMVWSKATNEVMAPFFLPDQKQQVNVIACQDC